MDKFYLEKSMVIQNFHITFNIKKKSIDLFIKQIVFFLCKYIKIKSIATITENINFEFRGLCYDWGIYRRLLNKCW